MLSFPTYFFFSFYQLETKHAQLTSSLRASQDSMVRNKQTKNAVAAQLLV